MITLRQAQALARGHGYTIRKNDGEYRLNIRGSDEATAYYTDDLGEAISTMLWEVMTARRVARATVRHLTDCVCGNKRALGLVSRAIHRDRRSTLNRERA